jgi:hypothetical protein
MFISIFCPEYKSVENVPQQKQDFWVLHLEENTGNWYLHLHQGDHLPFI